MKRPTSMHISQPKLLHASSIPPRGASLMEIDGDDSFDAPPSVPTAVHGRPAMHKRTVSAAMTPIEALAQQGIRRAQDVSIEEAWSVYGTRNRAVTVSASPSTQSTAGQVTPHGRPPKSPLRNQAAAGAAPAPRPGQGRRRSLSTSALPSRPRSLIPEQYHMTRELKWLTEGSPFRTVATVGSANPPTSPTDDVGTPRSASRGPSQTRATRPARSSSGGMTPSPPIKLAPGALPPLAAREASPPSPSQQLRRSPPRTTKMVPPSQKHQPKKYLVPLAGDSSRRASASGSGPRRGSASKAAPLPVTAQRSDRDQARLERQVQQTLAYRRNSAMKGLANRPRNNVFVHTTLSKSIKHKDSMEMLAVKRHSADRAVSPCTVASRMQAERQRAATVTAAGSPFVTPDPFSAPFVDRKASIAESTASDDPLPPTPRQTRQLWKNLEESLGFKLAGTSPDSDSQSMRSARSTSGRSSQRQGSPSSLSGSPASASGSRIPIASYRINARTTSDDTAQKYVTADGHEGTILFFGSKAAGATVRQIMVPASSSSTAYERPRRSSLRSAPGTAQPSRCASPMTPSGDVVMHDARSVAMRETQSTASSVGSMTELSPNELASLWDRRGSAVSAYSQTSFISSSESEGGDWDAGVELDVDTTGAANPMLIRMRLAEAARKHNAKHGLAALTASVLRTGSVELAVEQMTPFRC